MKLETPLPQLAPQLSQHGVTVNYMRLWAMGSAGIIPTVRRKGRVFAVGDPADLAAIIRPHLNHRKNAA